jgi:acetyl-CoA carboxylase carboxyltransferase component
MLSAIPLRGRVPGTTSASVVAFGPDARRVVLVRVDPSLRRGALAEEDSGTIAAAARLAHDQQLPFIAVVATSGADVHDGVSALHGWGTAARALARCSGVVPVLFAVVGPALSGPALLLGMADLVAMTTDAVAFVSGPAAVAQMTGLELTPHQLGGAPVHARSTGVAGLVAGDEDGVLELLAELLAYLPDHADSPAPIDDRGDPPDRPTPELRSVLPDAATGSYDIREVAAAIADDGILFEIRAGWAPQLVTTLARVGGFPVGIIANQPRTMAGTLDIAASQKGARFVTFCDSFNLPLITLVDTPGFMPGKDLEWRGMIRHGAQLVFAYAEATVPRICLILRKAYGGAYIVMDSKAMGNDLCLAWPSAEVAVMGAQGAVQILHRRASAEAQVRLVSEYQTDYLNPYTAAERGYVDLVIDPGDTRAVMAETIRRLASKRERLPGRKHSNSPL